MSKSVSSWPLIGVLLVTVVTSPNITYEPFDNIKLFFLGITAAYAIANFFATKGNPFRSPNSWFLISLVFLLALMIPLFFTSAPFAQQFYGAAGRSLGFLHYFFLFCIFLGVAYSGDNFNFYSFVKTLVAVGLFESVYGLIQYFNLDPIAWDNSSNWVFGTFGNPNFLSAFLGLSAVVSLFVKKFSFSNLWCYLSYVNVATCLIVIFISDSIQGLFIFGIGVSLLIQYIAFLRSKIFGFTVTLLSSITSVFVAFGVFGKGTLGKYLYQDSTTFRGDYWRAGLQMFKDNLLTGVGLDSYGDNYRFYRDSISANRRGLDLYSTSAHNIYLDLASTGGIFVIFTFLTFSLSILFVGFISLKKSKFKSIDMAVLLVLWLAFQAQLLISINVSSVAIWGFVIGGLIVRNKLTSGEVQKSKNSVQKSQILRKSNLYKLVFVPLFMFMVFPLLLRDIQLARAISNSSKDNLIAATTSWPTSCYYLAKTEEALSQVQDFPSSLSVSKRSVSINSKCFDSWRHIYDNPEASEVEKEGAWERMKELDPNLSK